MLFDRYIAVDWSASDKPSAGKDSIWIGESDSHGYVRSSENPRTRDLAMDYLRRRIRSVVEARERALICFDFPFGYPHGASTALGADGTWNGMWSLIAANVVDDNKNKSNRFEVASRLNQTLPTGSHLFWGHPDGRHYETLSARRNNVSYHHISELRAAEKLVKGANPSPVWKLNGSGSVGGQAIVGIARLNALLTEFRAHVAVWPFETGFDDDLSSAVVFAEIYPSIFPIVAKVEPRDRAQVESVVRSFSRLDRADKLDVLLSAPDALELGHRAHAIAEEGWILGVGNEHLLVEDEAPQSIGVASSDMDYLRDPDEIYRQSFATIASEADLGRFTDLERRIATRIIHACGMVDAAGDLYFSEEAAEIGVRAIEQGAPIICDVRMVEHGIIARYLQGNEIMTAIAQTDAKALAQNLGTTVSAGGMEALKENIEGAIMAIGNAPTALFHLLEGIENRWPKPALVLGFPVGFVGAAESKAALIANTSGVPYMALNGRRGGSAMAAAAVNALLIEAAK